MKNVLSLPAVRLALAVVFAVAGISSAFGDTILPNPVFLAELGESPNIVVGTHPGTFFATAGCDQPIGCEESMVTLSYTPSSPESSSIFVSGNSFLGNTEATGMMLYYVGVFGPFGAPVPLQIKSHGLATSTANTDSSMNQGFGGAEGEVDIFNNADPVLPGREIINMQFCSKSGPLSIFEPCEFPSEASGSDVIYVQPNVTGTQLSFIVLRVDGSSGINGGSGGPAGGSYFAELDPTVSFAPGFDSTGYTLLFSPEPIPEVPEPSNLLLLGSGITSLFWVARKKQRR